MRIYVDFCGFADTRTFFFSSKYLDFRAPSTAEEVVVCAVQEVECNECLWLYWEDDLLRITLSSVSLNS